MPNRAKNYLTYSASLFDYEGKKS